MTRVRDGSPGVGRAGSVADDRSAVRGAAAGVVAGLGVFFAVQHLASAGSAIAPAALYHVPFLLLSLSMLYAGLWLLTSGADHRRVSRVALWSFAGFLVLVAVGVWVSGGRTDGAARVVLDVGTVGASSGLLVGLEGERRRRELDAAARLETDRADEQFALFNRMLRHHVLNGMAVVRGHAELVAETCGDPPEAVDVIRARCDEIADLVRGVEALSRAFTGDLEVRPVDAVVLLAEAVEDARADGAEVGLVEGDLDGRLVEANERIDLVFAAVLDAAVEAASDDRVTVETATADGEFLASFAFDGSIRRDADGAVRPGEYGDEEFELFLAGTLIEYLEGSMVLPADDPDGALSVRLPLAD